MTLSVKILAIDEDPAVLQTVERVLDGRYECDLAGDLASARARLEAGSFDAVICDVGIAGESGLALIEDLLTERPETAAIPTAAADDPSVVERALDHGAYGYLVKPFLPGQLLITVQTALRRRELEASDRAHRRTPQENVGVSTEIAAQREAEELRQELAGGRTRMIEELISSRQEIVERLAGAIELHDPEPGCQRGRVARLTSYLASQLGLDDEQILLIGAAAPLHDVGKIATPDAILRKPGPLSAGERAEMQRHAEIGHQILSGSDAAVLRMAAQIALTHHEWFDGSGYPKGLEGGEIPIEGRIVAVVDVCDALLSDRPHRPAMSTEEALATIGAGRGTQFDPEVVDVLQRSEDLLQLRG